MLISFIFTMFHRWFRFCPIVSTIGLFLYIYKNIYKMVQDIMMTDKELEKRLLYTHIGLASIVVIGGFFILQPLIKEMIKEFKK